MKAYLIALLTVLVIGCNLLPAAPASAAPDSMGSHILQPCGPQGDVSG